MHISVKASMFAATFALSLAAISSAQAQQRCPEGRLANGKCVHAGLARDLRTGTIAYTQQKLSLTNPPVMPSQDGEYYVPRDHHDISNLHGYPPITSPAGNTLTFNRAGPTTVYVGPRP